MNHPERNIRNHKIPLRLILVVPFVLQILIIVGLTGWFSLRNGQKAINELASLWREEIDSRVKQELTNHLNTAKLVTQINVDMMRLGGLDPKNHKRSTDYLLTQFQQFPTLSGITIGTEQPNYVGLARSSEGTLVLTLWNQDLGGVIDYNLDESGEITSISKIDTDYDHRKRDWYSSAIKLGQPLWQEPYLTINPPRLVISFDRPFLDSRGQGQGVSDAELSLSNISDFLRNLQIGQTGKVYILENNGNLVASSTSQEPFQISSSSDEPIRLQASQSSDVSIRKTTNYLFKIFENLSDIQAPQQLDFKLKSERQFVQVTPFQESGLDWLVVIAVPESEFLGAIEQNTRTTIALCSFAAIVASVTGILISRWLVKPIHAIAESADMLSSGNLQQRIAEPRAKELATLAKAFNQMAGQIQTSLQSLEYNALHDPLTGLFNRTALQSKLQMAIDRSIQAAGEREVSSLFAVLILDLDEFKLVNDSFGHLYGDRLLVEVAQRLRSCFSDKQLGNVLTSQVARFGGDEFVILLDDVSDVDLIRQATRQILELFDRPFDLNGMEIFFGASIGIVFSSDEDRPEHYLRDADIALYCAKRDGKGKFEIFNPGMRSNTIERLHLGNELRRALSKGELSIFYQPIIDITSSRMSAFEALMRWHNPIHGKVSPAEFIPIAEETGLIVELGWWVLRQACLQMRSWQQKYSACLSMSMCVNLSSKQFSQIDFLDRVKQILRETEIDPDNLKLEITESIYMHSAVATEIKLRELKRLGVKLSVDDFGTGYSSLSYLYRFPIDTLKIDRSFIHNLGVSDDSSIIVESILLLGEKLGLDVVAEGVETMEEVRWLQDRGCKNAQGFLFSRPLPAQELDLLLSETVSIDNL
ncbi:MAG: EAL domain-containing protein [Cyanobacteria bacterium P01_D01_bin.123]